MLARLLAAATLAAALSLCGPALAQTQQVLSGQGCGSAGPNAGPGAPSFADAGGSHCVDTVNQGAAAYRGATVAAANTSQVMIPANPTRRGWNFQNQTGGVCYWKIGAAATQTALSFRVPDGGYFETPTSHVSTGAVNVNCATAGGGYYATEW